MSSQINQLNSWGLTTPSNAHILPILRSKPTPECYEDSEFCLPYGLGRSYGDSCLNNNNTLNPTWFIDMLSNFDAKNGTLIAEGGATLQSINNATIPKGWFTPVTPGTKYVTVGGAIANDIHGKNHHKVGSFGNHIEWIKLRRTNGDEILCSKTENTDYYKATIGGLGLTGLITLACIKLQKISSPYIIAKNTPYNSLKEFFEINQSSEDQNQYTVAWIDTLNQNGKGIYISGNHYDGNDTGPEEPKDALLNIPTHAPSLLLNPVSIKIFNTLYYLSKKNDQKEKLSNFESFFYPLDCLKNWNKLYGKRGFYQYQCVIPSCPNKIDVFKEILKTTSNQSSFLSVIKTFGSIKSEGYISFPTEGVTLALDIQNKGQQTLKMLEKLDSIVRESKGRLYPAKDARMPAELFKEGYPNWTKVEELRDKKISSNFWRRVTA